MLFIPPLFWRANPKVLHRTQNLISGWTAPSVPKLWLNYLFFDFWDVKLALQCQKLIRPEARVARNYGTEITFKSLVRITAPKNIQDNFQEWPRQSKPKKGQFMNFSQGHSGTKVRYVNRACFPEEKSEFTKMGKIHELFVLALSLVWFAGVTPEILWCSLYVTAPKMNCQQKDAVPCARKLRRIIYTPGISCAQTRHNQWPANISCKYWCVALRGFLLRRFWDVQGFPFCGGKKGLRLPLAMGKKGLRLPRFSRSDLGNEGVSDPFPHCKRESQTLFPTAKGKTRTSQNPLSENPLSAKHEIWHCRTGCLPSHISFNVAVLSCLSRCWLWVLIP